MPRRQFARGSSKAEKLAGSRVLEKTPLTIRSSPPLGSAFERRIRTQLASRLEHAIGSIERVTVRFEDVYGPRGGIDTACRIKVVISGHPSMIVEKRATSHQLAFADAADAVGQAVMRDKQRRQRRLREPARRPGTNQAAGAPRRPSRKSTRRPANRGKPSQTKERAAAARQQTPGVRAGRRG
jgi:hypothetical protein